jgi:adenine-specific DNA-methyltransferase
MQNNKYKQLIEVLREIFQLDQPDLDFGIYRIMNQKSAEISDFLENKLIPQVKMIIEEANLGDSATIAKELEEAIANAKNLGLEDAAIEGIAKVKNLRSQLDQTPSSDGLQKEVFSALTTFFQRYYDNGDFISKRRYRSDDTYAIPYNGEEVKLYWANHDQYYIKTSEYLKNYAFKISNNRKVRFELAEATAEKDNNQRDKRQRATFPNSGRKTFGNKRQ